MPELHGPIPVCAQILLEPYFLVQFLHTKIFTLSKILYLTTGATQKPRNICVKTTISLRRPTTVHNYRPRESPKQESPAVFTEVSKAEY